MTTTTPTYREYANERDLDEGAATFLIINTDDPDLLRLSAVTPEVVRTAHVAKPVARTLGMSLLAWSGDITSTIEPVPFLCERKYLHTSGAAQTVGEVVVEVTDGEAELTLGALKFTLDVNDRDDLAVRLIAFGGVDA